MPTDAITALHRLRCMLAAETLINRLVLLRNACKANFNPNQPRVPRGNPDGGQWTDDPRWTGAPGLSDPRVLSDATPDNTWQPGAQYAQGQRGPGSTRPILINGRLVQPTPAQATRLAAAELQAQAAFARVRTLDPNWRPRPSATSNSVEGLILRVEATAREAQARYEQLRSGIGGNFGPPLTPAPRPGTIPSSRSFDGPAWIDAYRSAHTSPDLFGNPRGLTENDTVAVADIDGRVTFGVNSDAITYTAADRSAAQKAVDVLVEKYPDLMKVDNIGQKPNDALYHAESTILLRAAQANSGTLTGRTIEVQVDREMCDSCRKVLPKLGVELGNPTVTYKDNLGVTRTMQDGRWLP